MTKALIAILSLFIVHQQAFASNYMVVEGRLLNSSNTPITGANVILHLDVYSPGSEACLLYSESHTIDMTVSEGYFNVNLGEGVRSGSNFQDTSVLLNILNNQINNAGITTCVSGSAYNPSATHGRLLRVSYDAGSGLQTLNQDIEIGASQYANYAYSLQGRTASDFLQVNSDSGYNLTQTNLNTVFNSTNFSALQQLLDGTSPYFDATPTAVVDNGNQRITNVAAPSSGSDVANKTYVDSSLGGMNLDSAGIQSLSVGNANEVLTWNGTQWVSQAVSALDNTKLPLAGGTLTGALAMGGNSITGIQNLMTTNDITVGNNIIVSGGISTSTGVNSNGFISINNQNELRLADSDSSNYVALRAPANVISNIVWTLPANDGSAGQILSTDGAGNLSWVTGGGGEASFNISLIPNIPTGSISASNLQAAINELDNEKVAITGSSMTGNLEVQSGVGIRWRDSINNNFVGFTGPNSDIPSDITWQLPGADGVNGQVLQTNGLGMLSWGNKLSTGVVGGAEIGNNVINAIHLDAGAGSSGQYLKYNGSALEWDDIILGPNAVASANIINGAVTNSHIANDAINSAKIADGSITPMDILGGGLTGQVLSFNAGSFAWMTPATFADGTSPMFAPLRGVAGTVTNPSFTFSSDTNTGIYAPAADTVSLVTGGIERMTINAAGRVGIGTTSPDPGSLLQVRRDLNSPSAILTTNVAAGAAASAEYMVEANSGMASFGIASNTYTTIPLLQGKVFLQSDTANGLSLNSSSPSGAIDLNTNGARRLVVSGAGNVGIGSVNPTERLDIAGNVRISGSIDLGYIGGPSTCNAGNANKIQRNGSLLEYCNGTGPDWKVIAGKTCEGTFTAVPHGDSILCVKRLDAAASMAASTAACSTLANMHSTVCSLDQVKLAIAQSSPVVVAGTYGVSTLASTSSYYTITNANVIGTVADNISAQSFFCCY